MMSKKHDRGRTGRLRRRALIVAGAASTFELGALWRRGYGLGGRVIVRCRDGHLFTTIWVPGGSLKSLRAGPWRFQRCPVGRHWSWVTPVDRSTLSESELHTARDRTDLQIP